MSSLAVREKAILLDLKTNPVPAGARAAYFETSDKVKLRYAIWPRTTGPNRGTICLVHGRTETIEKYFETIADFRVRGFSVASFDWRGQGGSERFADNSYFGHVDRFEDYWIDLKSFHAEILLPDCPPPFYLVGHSMGGLASLISVSRDRLMFDRVFLSAPMLSFDGLPLSVPALATIFEGMRLAGLGRLPFRRPQDKPASEEGFPGNPLTSDFKRYMRGVDIFRNRPDLITTSPTISWAATALRTMARIAGDDFPAQINVPVLMLAAARDTVVSTAAIEQLGLRMRTGRHAVIAGARHELFMESDSIRAQVLAAFDAFVTEQSAR
jgi:lysophospholipase